MINNVSMYFSFEVLYILNNNRYTKKVNYCNSELYKHNNSTKVYENEHFLFEKEHPITNSILKYSTGVTESIP